MEKLAPRLSGGGAKLGTLDMQSYLEVMGRQLDEIQAQHQQFYASRQDRVGRVRAQEHPGQVGKRWSSESHAVPQQPGGEKLDGQGDSASQEDQLQQQQDSSGDSVVGLRSSSTNQSVARRFLHFGDGPPADSRAVVSQTSIHTSRGEKTMEMNACVISVSRERPWTCTELAKGQARQLSVQESTESRSELESVPVAQYVSPLPASARQQFDIPDTPSRYSGQSKAGFMLEGSPSGTASSSHITKLGPYAVYDAGGVASISCRPDSRHYDFPLTGSASSGSLDAWQESRAEGDGTRPRPGLSVFRGAITSPSTASAGSSISAANYSQSGTENYAAIDDGVSPPNFALLGGPYDCIDSAEDEDGQPASANLNLYGTRRTHTVGSGSVESTQHALKHEKSNSQQGTQQAASQFHAMGVNSDSRSQPRTGPRAPLVTASLETEEALRALLATPRFAPNRSDAVAASVDVDSLEVPDDVLSALARTDGMDLDAALGAAMASSLREHAAQEQSDLSSVRSAQQAQSHASSAQIGHSRPRVLGPGALTAAPVAVPIAVAGRGFDISMRSAGGANLRVGSAGGGPSAAPLLPRDAVQSQAVQAERSAAPVDASMEIDRLDMLSQTMDISLDTRGLSTNGLRDSASCAALIAAQVAAAQQHSQPVLYSLVPKSRAPTDKGSRRNTLDGEVKRSFLSTVDSGSRRNTVDGGSRRNTVEGNSRRNTVEGNSRRNTVEGNSRRNTVDDCILLIDDKDAGQAHVSEHMHGQCLSATSSLKPTGLVGGSNSARSELLPLTALPNAGAAAPGQGKAINQTIGPGPEVCEAVSPLRPVRGSANMASPSAASSVARQGVDGDLVLYGSPSQKIDGGVSPSVTASPYMPPSPPPGADPSPYLSSPTVPHVGSRLQRSSRKLDEDAVAGSRQYTDIERGQAGTDDGLGTACVAAASYRLWSVSGTQFSSKRHLTGASGTSSGANMHLDLSLAQAAAAAATSSIRAGTLGVHHSGGVTPGALSPAVSQRQLRVQAPQHLPTLQKQQPDHLQASPHIEAPQLPSQPSFSLASLTPPSRPSNGILSHDLGVDDVGQPMPSVPAAIDTNAPSINAEIPVVNSSNNQNSKVQLQAISLPVSAFSRAAALAAAADVGMAAPPPAVERRKVPDTRAAHMDTTASLPSDLCTSARTSSTGRENTTEVVGALEAANVAVGQHLHGQTKHVEAASDQEDKAVDGRHAYQEHPELVQGQSPGPISSAPSAAKLSQLKARRQQQWQSQYGLQPHQSLPPAAIQPQAPGAVHCEQDTMDTHHVHRSSRPVVPGVAGTTAENFGYQAGPTTGSTLSSAPLNAVIPEITLASPLSAPVSSPLLPDAVAEAITRTAGSKKDSAVSGELNLGHGISRISVAIEAGQVKWAWQTDAKGKPGNGRLDMAAEDPSSPGGNSNDSSSPWASPAVGRAAVRDSNTEWALQQLPPPQWQRLGQLPAGGHVQMPKEQQRQGAACVAMGLQTRLQDEEGEDSQRRFEHSLTDETVNSGAGTRQHNHAVSGGGFSAQEATQLRFPSATEGGGQPNSKALALLRLKRQSIMRHNVQVGTAKESGGETEVADQHTQGTIEPAMRPHASSAGQEQLMQRHPPRQVFVSHVSQIDVRDRPHSSKAAAPELDDIEAGGRDGAGSQAQPKPFLRRRSAKVQARKVDWSYVKPRTNSRNPDYYGELNSPDAAMRPRVSPLTSPRGGVAKPPLNVNVGARVKKPGIKVPLTPTEDDQTPGGVPVRRHRLSNIPLAPGAMQFPGASAEERRVHGMGTRRAVGGPLSPLDDLLAHVNTLLKDFDKIVL